MNEFFYRKLCIVMYVIDAISHDAGSVIIQASTIERIIDFSI